MNLSLQKKDKKYLWHPYTQMKDYQTRDLLIIDHAQGNYLYDEHGKRYFDTISSWWCILHGHNHPTMQEFVSRQLHRLDQVLLAGTSHEPAILLAEKLVKLTSAPLSKIFFSDNGSTACEVALKMSLQYWRHRELPAKNRFISLERGYHGDTIGTMSLGGVPEFHQEFKSILFPSFSLPSPHCYRCPMNREPGSCELECLNPLETLLAEKSEQVAAFILEPLLQAAGGMRMYPPAYLNRAAKLTKKYNIHLILDEVATGFGRTGRMFAYEHAGIVPDFLCLSKGLTGGMLAMGATVTSDKIYNAFYADYGENKTFYHGHTFTGNPLASAAALGSLQVFAEEKSLDYIQSIIPHLHQGMERFRALEWVGDVRCLGMICALELVKDKTSKEEFSFSERVGWKIYLKGLEKGLILRPMGNTVYLWLPLSTSRDEVDEIVELTYQVVADPKNIVGL